MTQNSTVRLEGSWIQTYTGKQFYPADPRPEDFDIIDIAHALSMNNRYTGHTKFPYSVGQHCVYVSKNVASQHALAGLLHDASEAYIADIARPVKRLPELAGYLTLEKKIETALAERFGVSYPWHPQIKEADVRVLLTEKRDIMGYSPHRWTEIILQPYDFHIEEMDWKAVKEAYLNRFFELGGKE